MNARSMSAASRASANACGAGQYGGGWTSGAGGADEGARTVVDGTEKMCGYSERELMRLIERCGLGPEAVASIGISIASDLGRPNHL